MAYRNHRDSSFVVGEIDLDKSFETNLIPQGPLSNSPKGVLEVESLGLKWGFEDLRIRNGFRGLQSFMSYTMYYK